MDDNVLSWYFMGRIVRRGGVSGLVSVAGNYIRKGEQLPMNFQALDANHTMRYANPTSSLASLFVN
jgi:hypothetical protein